VLDSVTGDLRKPEGGWSFRLQGFPNVGYLRIDNFGDKTGDELNAALATYDKEPVDALIIDLRDNPGGMLDAAVAACDAFIAGGTIVSTRGRDNDIRRVYSAQPVIRFPIDVPIVVLANGNSASAAEIFAACLQDHGRATVVGERTYGKGTVQTVIRMEGGRSALKLTTASYWRPNGHNIHRFPEDGPEKEWGVMPDEGMTVPLTDEQRIARYRWRRRRDVAELVHAPPVAPAEGTAAADDSIEANDPQLSKALEVAREKIRRQRESLEAA
jgi:carboxyl-terminal processing protease